MARDVLYKQLQISNRDTVYLDTDSIYAKENINKPLFESSSLLGGFKNELESNQRIEEFVALAPKTYSYKLISIEDNVPSTSYTVKSKGFKADAQSRNILTHENYKKILEGELETLIVPNTLFKIGQLGGVKLLEGSKTLSYDYQKRYIRSNGKTLPWGWVSRSKWKK